MARGARCYSTHERGTCGQLGLEAIFLGSRTGFWEFNYAGKACEIFSNSVIENGVPRVAGWLSFSFVLM